MTCNEAITFKQYNKLIESGYKPVSSGVTEMSRTSSFRLYNIEMYEPGYNDVKWINNFLPLISPQIPD